MTVRSEHLQQMQKTGVAYTNEVREMATECLQSRECGGPIVAPILREVSFSMHTMREGQTTVFIHEGKTFVLTRSV